MTGPTISHRTQLTQPGSAHYQLGNRNETMVFDGKLEDAVVSHVFERDQLVSDVKDLAVLFTDPKVAEAEQKLNSGAERVEVTLGDKGKFEAIKAGDETRFYPADSYLSEHSLAKSGDKGFIRVDTGLSSGKERVQQQVVGQFNPSNGTITCVFEEVNVSPFG